MLDDKDISINRSLKMWKNLPIDSRQFTESLAKLDEFIQYPWVGMLFYSEEEDDYYKVISLADGYKSIRTGTIVRREEMGDVAGIRPIKGVFVGEYQQLTLKGNVASSIVKAEIRQGYLWITFHDGTDVNTGYVLGDPGYSPQVTENKNNTEDVYKLDITYQNLENILNTFTTPNLIGPEGKRVILNTNDEYIVWKYEGETEWKNLIAIQAISGKNGNDGNDGREIELTSDSEYVKWRYYNPNTGEYGDWKNLISIESLKVKGDKGDNGESVELRVNNDIIQWKLQSDSTWNNLISIKELSGRDGKSIYINSITVNELQPSETPTASAIINSQTETQINYDFTFNIPKGNKGEDGYTPSVTAVKENGVTIVTLTNLVNGKEVTNTVEILDGATAEKGEDGYSPTVTAVKNNGVTTVNITSKVNDKIVTTSIEILDGADGADGAKGDPGFSPTISSEPTSAGTKVTITDENGDHTFNVLNGVNGADGADGAKGDPGFSPTVNTESTGTGTKVTITDENGDHVFNIKNGSNGADGADGAKGDPGFSPTVTTKTVENETEVTITDENGDHVFIIRNGSNGTDGKYMEVGNVTTTTGLVGSSPNVSITLNDTLSDSTKNVYDFSFTIPEGIEGTNGKNMEVGNVTVNSLPSTSDASVNITLNTSLSDNTKNVYNFTFGIPKGEKGEDGVKGDPGVDGTNGIDGINGKNMEVGNVTVNSLPSTSDASVTIVLNDASSTTTKNVYDFTFDIPKGEKGADGTNGIDGKSIEVGSISTNTLETGSNASVTIILNTSSSDDTKNVYDFTFGIPKGEDGAKGDPGIDGTNGIDGNNGKNIEIGTVTTNTIAPGSDAEVLIVLNTSSSDDTKNVYDFTFSIPSGVDGNDGYSPTVTENENNTSTIYKLDITYKDDTGTIQTYTTPNLKGTDGNAANFEVVTTLPDIALAKTDTIYLLLTPEYQRGLNIGYTDDTNANKNFYEEWVVIEDETTSDRTWELLAPQQYRISRAMIDYLWGLKKNFTVYDDYETEEDIPEYQKGFGEITPLRDFIYRVEGDNLILVKYIGSGDVNLNIAPYYKVGDKTYTSVQIDGTYDPSYTYHKVDSDGNQTIYNDFAKDYPPNIDANGIDISQTFLTGPNVYSLYIADTITSIKRVLINTSNIPVYHIPSNITEIGDYAFYNSANQTMVFERLNPDGKTATRVGFESSNVERIGEWACAETTNMRWLDDNGNASITLKTPASLKKISNHAFYKAHQMAHIDTRLSSNLYIGKSAFTATVLTAEQWFSPTTYYTDSSVLGFQNLYHDSNRNIGSGSLFFSDINFIGYNYNDVAHTEASETDKLSVTLTSVDPTFES